MKNKSKLKKLHEKKQPVRNVPAEWLYLLPEETKLRSIYELFGEDMPWKAEFWEEAGVLEIELPDAGSMDMECMDTDLGDEAGNAYLAEHKIKTVFAVTIVPEDYEKIRGIMGKIIEKKGGFFCGDTEDFKPEVRKISLEGRASS